jgi:hypothetical protein
MPLRCCISFQDEPDIMGPLLTPSFEFEAADKADLYYSRKELNEIRFDAKQLGQTVSRKQDPTNPLAYKNVMERSYRACVKGGIPSNTDMEYLIHWTSACPMRRGLEKACVPALGVARTKRTNYCVAAVLAMQQRATPEEREQKMRAVSEQLSIPSRSLARVHGIVDATVARLGSDFFAQKRAAEEEVEGPCAKRACLAMPQETPTTSDPQQQQLVASM